MSSICVPPICGGESNEFHKKLATRVKVQFLHRQDSTGTGLVTRLVLLQLVAPKPSITESSSYLLRDFPNKVRRLVLHGGYVLIVLDGSKKIVHGTQK